MLVHNDTIVARATAAGASAVSVVRISGTRAVEMCNGITHGKTETIGSHQVKLRNIFVGKVQLDEALVAVFKAPNSFTGEECVEISLHGSDFISVSVLQELVKLGARMAEPGEFTMRAYLNGRLDLSQAEAVADLIAAQTVAEHKMALGQMKGGVSHKIKDLRAKILEFAALIELELDFGEEDVEFADRTSLTAMVEQLLTEVQQLLNTFKSGNAIKEGIPIAIVGKPNSGKSTLLNALLGEDRAIVTNIPGTTRDTIEETINMFGMRFRFIDTAGIREAENLVEKIGIEKTYKSIEKASLVWLLLDMDDTSKFEINQQLQFIISLTEGETWLVGNKMDRISNNDSIEMPEMVTISAKNGELASLLSRLEIYANGLLEGAGDTTISNLRHYEVLMHAKASLKEVLRAIQTGLTGDMLAHHMRNAMHELGRITGEIDNDEVLGQIFSKFCIGK